MPQFNRFRLSATIAALALAAVVAGCSNDDNKTTTAPAASTKPDIALSDYSVTLVRSAATPNPTKQVTVTTANTSSSTVTWSAGDPAVATISPSGLITAKGDGSTFFTATLQSDPTINRTVVVNVVSTVLTVSPTSTFTWVGGPNRTIASTVQNNPNTSVTWSSSNTAVATVSATGVVTPVSAGTATITATSVGDPAKTAITTITVDPAPGNETLLTSGASKTGLSGATGTQSYYRIEVPVGATSLKVETTGGTGDLDLYVRAGSRPTFSTFTCASGGATATETCTINNPSPRVYYIMLDAYAAYSGVTLTATVTP